MVLYFIGLGLGDEKDITVKGLEAIKRCTKVYLESYTSILSTPKSVLEQFYGKELIEADRMFVESQCEEMLQLSIHHEIAFLVVGDPFCATTHADLFLRASELNIKIEIIHNASIFTAVALTGMQLYKFGETISVPFFTDNWRPYSFYDKIYRNKEKGLHTLVLLDIKVKEQSEEDLIRGRLVFQPPRFMDVNVAARQILEAENDRQLGCACENTLVLAALRIGTLTQKVVVKTLKELAGEEDYGQPLHSIVIPGDMDEIEQRMLQYHQNNSKIP
jgi:diphthine methyl ester synthase